MGTSAAADNAAPARGDRAAKPASTVSTAIAPTANSPAGEPVTTRWVTPRPVAAQINPTRPASAPRWICAVPHGFNRDAEKITAASAMSSTMPGAAGPAGTGCKANRSPSTTPTVPRLASRLNGAPPIGARLSRAGVAGPVAALPLLTSSSETAGTTKRSTAGRISRSGSSAGSAISVSRLSARIATRTTGITALDITDSSDFCGTLLLFLFVNSGCSWKAQTARELDCVLKSRDSRFPSNQWPSGNSAVSCSTATAMANAVPGLKRGDPFAVEGTRRADQHSARSGVDDAHTHFGAGVLSVVAAAGDDLHIAARPGEHRLHHGTR